MSRFVPYDLEAGLVSCVEASVEAVLETSDPLHGSGR